MKSQSDLANAINHESVTTAVIQNLEAGRKTEVTVSQLLNIAFALGMPPAFLLAPLGSSGARLDLPNLAEELAGLSPAEFDAWLSGLPNGTHRFNSAEEQLSISQLEAIRQLAQTDRELHRLRVLKQLEEQENLAAGASDSGLKWDSFDNQISTAEERRAKLESYLQGSGFPTGPSAYGN
jgi:transcriptional regulator with XRE-family HTH domain